jgi:hypothetical protein
MMLSILYMYVIICEIYFSHYQQQRRLDLITITHPDNLYPEESKRIVFVSSRVHPGETPASFVCQGMVHLSAMLLKAVILVLT